MSFIKETFGASNLKTTGYIFIVVGLLYMVYAAFSSSPSAEKQETLDKKINALSQSQDSQSISQTGLMFALAGLILVSVNRN